MVTQPLLPPATAVLATAATTTAADAALVPITAAWLLDVAGQRLLGPAGEVLLPALEFRLLDILCRHPHQVFSRDELLDLAWGSEFDGTDRVVDRAICRLRQLLNPGPGQPRAIRTRRGAGYCFCPPPAP